MAKSVFVTRRKDIMNSKAITALVLHLFDPERCPLDVEAHLAKLTGNSMVLATQVLAERRGKDFHALAQALALNG